MSDHDKSPTPRTDAALMVGIRGNVWTSRGKPIVPADFARQLERELAEARKWLAGRPSDTMLSNSLARAERAESERDQLRAEVADLTEQLRHEMRQDAAQLRAQLAEARKDVNVVSVPEAGAPENKWLRIGPAQATALLAERDELRAQLSRRDEALKVARGALEKAIGHVENDKVSSILLTALTRIDQLTKETP